MASFRVWKFGSLAAVTRWRLLAGTVAVVSGGAVSPWSWDAGSRGADSSGLVAAGAGDGVTRLPFLSASMLDESSEGGAAAVGTLLKLSFGCLLSPQYISYCTLGSPPWILFLWISRWSPFTTLSQRIHLNFALLGRPLGELLLGGMDTTDLKAGSTSKHTFNK